MLEKFIEMASDIKDIELHFTIGDALVFCALGRLSPATRDVWAVAEEDFSLPADQGKDQEQGLAWLVTKLTQELTRSTHPNIKQASCLWLLAVVKHCINQAVVRQQLLDIQKAFMNLLGKQLKSVKSPMIK